MKKIILTLVLTANLAAAYAYQGVGGNGQLGGSLGPSYPNLQNTVQVDPNLAAAVGTKRPIDVVRVCQWGSQYVVFRDVATGNISAVQMNDGDGKTVGCEGK